MLSVYLAMVGTDEEKDTITRLYKTYKKFLFSISMSILNNYADAEDAVHETFVRIIKNLSKIKDVESTKTKSFVAIIVRNICYDMLRKGSRETLFDDSDLKEYIVADTEKEAEIRLDYESVMNNIHHLSPLLKNIATLYFVMQYSVSEIGEIHELSDSAVYAGISRARRILAAKKGENKYE